MTRLGVPENLREISKYSRGKVAPYQGAEHGLGR